MTHSETPTAALGRRLARATGRVRDPGLRLDTRGIRGTGGTPGGGHMVNVVEPKRYNLAVLAFLRGMAAGR